MKKYQADGYTFTEEELQGENPYANEDGTPGENPFGFFAFNKARVTYMLEQMTPEERESELARRRHFRDKMQSGNL